MTKELTDYEVEQEIERLKKSKHVKLARKEQRLKYKQRQYLYSLRNLEKRGIELERQGFTYETLDSLEKEME